MRPVAPTRTADLLADEAKTALDWPRLVEALQQRAATSLGHERCADPPLADDPDEIRFRLRQVSQLRQITRENALPLGGIRDVREHVTR